MRILTTIIESMILGLYLLFFAMLIVVPIILIIQKLSEMALGTILLIVFVVILFSFLGYFFNKFILNNK